MQKIAEGNAASLGCSARPLVLGKDIHFLQGTFTSSKRPREAESDACMSGMWQQYAGHVCIPMTTFALWMAD
jgi:hypothetical protein